ncbi:hypothetical protein TUSST3_72700 [Streptomyces sp. TUS-ST3]|nr:hypothetical protein TUSST3_72700 [Streptomyces sp. TUS-ST3]
MPAAQLRVRWGRVQRVRFGGWVGAGVGGIRPRSGGSADSKGPGNGRRPLRADTPHPVPLPPYAANRRWWQRPIPAQVTATP